MDDRAGGGSGSGGSDDAGQEPDFGPFLEQLGSAVQEGVRAFREAAARGVRREGDVFFAAGGDGSIPLARFQGHGTLVLLDPRFTPPRRLAAFDAGGRLLEWLRWSPDGPLKRLGLVLPGDIALGVVAGVEDHSIWGTCDAVVLLGANAAPVRTLCRAAASDFENLRFIPPLDEPAAVPPGGGAALMNLFAELMQDQNVPEARYRGPYPTEALLETLLESFVPADAGDEVGDAATGGDEGRKPPARLSDFVKRFTEGVEEKALAGELAVSPLAFRPAPHDRRLLGENAAVQVRGGLVERFLVDGTSYTTPQVAGFLRQGSRVLHGGEDGWLKASLVILGEPVEHHYLVAVDGLKYAVNDRDVPPVEPEAMSPLWAEAVRVLIAHHSAKLIVPAALEIAGSLAYVWGTTGRQTASLSGQELSLHPAFRYVFREKRQNTPDPAQREFLAKALVTEIFLAAAPLIRSRAQRALERLQPLEQQEYVRFATEEFDAAAYVREHSPKVAELVAALIRE